MHADLELPILLFEEAVAGAKVEFLPAGDLVVVKIIDRGALVLEHLGVVDRDRGGRQRAVAVVVIEEHREVSGLADETGGRAVVAGVKVVRLRGVNDRFLEHHGVVVLDVKHPGGHLDAIPLAGHRQAQGDILRSVDPVTLGDVEEILVQPLGQQHVVIILCQAVSAELAYRRFAGNETHHRKGVRLVGPDQVEAELQCDAVLNSELLPGVGGRNEKLLAGRLVHADLELAILLLEEAVASAEVKLLPAGDLVVVEIIDHPGQRGIIQGKNEGYDSHSLHPVRQ